MQRFPRMEDVSQYIGRSAFVESQFRSSAVPRVRGNATRSLTSALSRESVSRCRVRVSINAFPWSARIPWLSFRKHESFDERESRRRWRRRRPRPQRPERITEDQEECTLSMSFFQPSGGRVSFRSLARSLARSRGN